MRNHQRLPRIYQHLGNLHFTEIHSKSFAYASLKKFMGQRIHTRQSKFLAKLQLKILLFFFFSLYFSCPPFQLHPYRTLYSFSVPFINFSVNEYDFRTGSYQHMYASDFPPYKFASFLHFILLNPFHHHLSLSISISVTLILGCSYFLAMDHHQC